jgi:hypothetical protein
MSGTVTYARILDAQNAELERVRTSTFANSFAAAKTAQWNSEVALLSQNNYCPMVKDALGNNSLTTQLEEVSPQKLQALVSGDFYDPSSMKAAMCESSSIYLDQNGLAANERIREWMSGLKQIGSESVEGYATMANFGEESLPGIAPGLFVIKAPRSVVSSDELIHETFVAIKGLNDLRSFIPNFAQIFGMFRCSPPFIDPTSKKVVAWCDSLSKRIVTYAIYENVSPNKSIDKLISNGITAEAYMKIYMQFLLSERMAFRKNGFTHYDAHTENGIVRDSGKGDISIPYDSADGPIFLRSEDGSVFTFIDYGMSHIAIKVTQPDGSVSLNHYGHVGRSAPLNSYGIYRDRAHPMHDCYKLLCYSLQSMYYKNRPTFDRLAPLFRFFNATETWEQVMATQANLYYYLPWEMISSADPATQPDQAFNDSAIALDEWTNECRVYMINNLRMPDPFLKSVPAGSKELTCGTVCMTPLTALQATGITLGTLGIPRTFYEFYDIFNHLNGRPQDQRMILNNFLMTDQDGVGSIFHHAAEREEARLSLLADVVMGVDAGGKPSLQYGMVPPMIKLTRPYVSLMDDIVLQNCKIILANVALWLDSYQRLLRGTNIMRYITELFANATGEDAKVVNKLRLVVNQLFTVLTTRKPVYDAYASNIREEIAYITPGVQTQEYVDFLNATSGGDNEKYKWYVNTVPSMESLIDIAFA